MQMLMTPASVIVSVVVDLINGLGVHVALPLAGIYFIVAAIVNDLFLPKRRIGGVGRRVLLGLLGVVLAVPLVYSIYQINLGRSGPLLPPSIPEHVAEPASATSSLVKDHVGNRGALIVPVRSPDSRMGPAAKPTVTPAVSMALQRSRVVESFGLTRQSIRKLRYRPFGGQIYVYVGAVGPQPEIYVFISRDSWPPNGQVRLDEFQRRYQRLDPQQRWHERIGRVGDSVSFLFNYHRFRLTVSQIIHPVVGPNQVALEVHELT